MEGKERMELDREIWFRDIEPFNQFGVQFDEIEGDLVKAARQIGPDRCEEESAFLERLAEAYHSIRSGVEGAAFEAGWYMAKGNISGAEESYRKYITTERDLIEYHARCWQPEPETGKGGDEDSNLHLV